MVSVTYADLFGPCGALEGPAAAGLSIPTWVSGGIAAWGAYADGIGGTDWCWGWNMSPAMEMSRPTMGAGGGRRGQSQSARADLYLGIWVFGYLGACVVLGRKLKDIFPSRSKCPNVQIVIRNA